MTLDRIAIVGAGGLGHCTRCLVGTGLKRRRAVGTQCGANRRNEEDSRKPLLSSRDPAAAIDPPNESISTMSQLRTWLFLSRRP